MTRFKCGCWGGGCSCGALAREEAKAVLAVTGQPIVDLSGADVALVVEGLRLIAVGFAHDPAERRQAREIADLLEQDVQPAIAQEGGLS